MKRVEIVIVFLMLALCEVYAVTLPSTSYMSYDEQPESEVYLTSGTLITGNYVALYENDCNYKGEPTLCQNCCSVKVQSCIEHCSGDQTCIVECASSNLTCVDDCIEGRSLPLDSTWCGILLSLSAIAVSLIRLKIDSKRH